MEQRFAKQYILTLLITTCFFFPGSIKAQQFYSDTLKLSVAKAEDIFLQKNLQLIATRYNINIAKAEVLQAKLWDNPVLNTDQNVYDGRFIRHTKENGQLYGQVYIQVQQLIRTAGKIKKQTQLAQDNVMSAEAQFNDLMRSLKFILVTDLNNLSQLQFSATLYLGEMVTMETLANGMDQMLKIGDISQKENVRIKALLFSLQSDYNNNLTQQYDLQKELSDLLQIDEKTWLVADADQPLDKDHVSNLTIEALEDSAQQLRPDLAFAKDQSVFQQHNILYQKSLAKPDVTVGMEYDRLSSYVPNYYGLAVSLPLPLFNQNKGNIAAANLAYAQSKTAVDEAESKVNKEVIGAWQKLLNATSMINNKNVQLGDNYEALMKNMTKSYEQRQVNLVEYIDFFEAYKETRIQQVQLLTNQRNAAAELNYTVNSNILKL